MNTQGEIIFELLRGDQIFKNPVMVKTKDGGYKNIGYAKGTTTINVDEHPKGITYEPVYSPYRRFVVTDPLLVQFLKSQQSFSNVAGKGRLWIHDSKEKAKQENDMRRTYVDAMTYIDSLNEEDLNVKAFAKIGTSIMGLTEEEIKNALYKIADENPKEILDLKDNTTYDFIGKAIYNQVIELSKGNFYLYGERNNLLFQTPHGMNSKERFADFLKTTEGKPVADLIMSKMPLKEDAELKARDFVLTDVRGVGAGFEKALQDAGILTITQLAEYDDETLRSRLYDSGYVVPKVINVPQILLNAKKIIKRQKEQVEKA